MNLFIALVQKELNVTVTPEYRFDDTRKWRIDYAIVPHKIAIEVEGGAYTNGRHTRPMGFIGDMEKYNALTVQGWRLIRVQPKDLVTVKTLNMIKSTINAI
jgi:very-short-patch-repair endonuclease